MVGKLYNNTRIIEKALDASLLRNSTISNNIANVDTPGYKKKTVLFEEIMNYSMKNSLNGFKTNNNHISIGTSRFDKTEAKVIEKNDQLSMRIDGNNVDIENEMAALAKNNIKYNMLVQNLNSGFGRLKTVINEGRR